jgi:hypothetical protein
MLFSFRAYAFLALSSLSAVVAAPTRRDTYNNRAHVLPEMCHCAKCRAAIKPGGGADPWMIEINNAYYLLYTTYASLRCALSLG